ncbi:(3S)-malyl-CoA thioesterase [Palleronia aestuarii]|uniref:(3S)-malyl-CoA thioesterase n=1 Tax=Palleronia aestuarii TaxID=568105 RepID=A0A2W7NP23_9RHOB|nr:CoA ester lyase [Palleronia aestuarii]PZX18354.1 (3S)-malyl-CoA thioesterase [Palleronia aestuarii]
MPPSPRPRRSVLYIPGSNARALEKARDLPADAIIFDLEDAVAVDGKVDARHTLEAALEQGGYGERTRIVRINGLDTPWGEDDLIEIAATGPDAILLPKVNSAADIERLNAALDETGGTSTTRIWAMMETASSVFHAAEIVTAPRLDGLVIGTNDLAAELGCRPGADRAPLMMALQTYVAAARMVGIDCIDGVFNAFRDEEGLRAECLQGRMLGMDGKTLIHPSQIAVANEIFAPSAEEVDRARRQIEAWEAAKREGKGIAVLDGEIVENLHVAAAQATLARDRAAKEASR